MFIFLLSFLFAYLTKSEKCFLSTDDYIKGRYVKASGDAQVYPIFKKVECDPSHHFYIYFLKGKGWAADEYAFNPHPYAICASESKTPDECNSWKINGVVNELTHLLECPVANCEGMSIVGNDNQGDCNGPFAKVQSEPNTFKTVRGDKLLFFDTTYNAWICGDKKLGCDHNSFTWGQAGHGWIDVSGRGVDNVNPGDMISFQTKSNQITLKCLSKAPEFKTVDANVGEKFCMKSYNDGLGTQFGHFNGEWVANGQSNEGHHVFERETSDCGTKQKFFLYFSYDSWYIYSTMGSNTYFATCESTTDKSSPFACTKWSFDKTAKFVKGECQDHIQCKKFDWSTSTDNVQPKSTIEGIQFFNQEEEGDSDKISGPFKIVQHRKYISEKGWILQFSEHRGWIVYKDGDVCNPQHVAYYQQPLVPVAPKSGNKLIQAGEVISVPNFPDSLKCVL